jgi:hypothetical protein
MWLINILNISLPCNLWLSVNRLRSYLHIACYYHGKSMKWLYCIRTNVLILIYIYIQASWNIIRMMYANIIIILTWLSHVYQSYSCYCSCFVEYTCIKYFPVFHVGILLTAWSWERICWARIRHLIFMLVCVRTPAFFLALSYFLV